VAGVELDKVSKIYRGTDRVVDEVSLNVPDGSFTVLVGPSGCGKSTTLRLIAGLEKTDGGEVRIGGRVVNQVSPQRRNVAFVFQNYALYPHMTVAANMGFGLRMRGIPRSEIKDRVKTTATALGLDPLLGRYPLQLSGGERQRVALGRAIVRDPAVFLLDEPLSNLDAQLRAEMRVELSRIQRRLNATFVFVTHDQVEAMTLADVLAVMRSGVLQQVGPPEEVYARPANVFVASFIGSPKMNFFDGELSHEGTRTYFRMGAIRVAVPAAPRGANQSVILGVRPEHLTLDENGPLELRVDVIEALGGQKFVYGSVDGDTPLVLSIDPRLHPAEGDRFRLRAQEAHLHLFDKSSGLRLG
jgi:ABC-type sugar transport system ATPase subunit